MSRLFAARAKGPRLPREWAHKASAGPSEKKATSRRRSKHQGSLFSKSLRLHLLRHRGICFVEDKPAVQVGLDLAAGCGFGLDVVDDRVAQRDAQLFHVLSLLQNRVPPTDPVEIVDRGDRVCGIRIDLFFSACVTKPGT